MADAAHAFDPLFAPAGAASSNEVGLDTWPAQRPAELVRLADAGNGQAGNTLRRLAEIGFLPGVTLRVVARGWLRNGPVAVRVGQSTFALRSHEAALLRVRDVQVATGAHA